MALSQARVKRVAAVPVPREPLRNALFPGEHPVLEAAVSALSQGEPILVFDSPTREGETDLVALSERMTPELVRTLRQQGGGLLCATLPEPIRALLELPYLADVLQETGTRHPLLPRMIPSTFRYDRRSAFGIPINHRDTFTGIPDRDRALTILRLGEFVRWAVELPAARAQERFAREFVTPGHVPLLYAAPDLLRERRGHTELTTALAEMGGLTPSLALCEMLSDDGGPLSPAAARKLAARRGWTFVEGREILEAWSQWSA